MPLYWGGVKSICDNVIIAAGAVVTKDITESYTVWAGVNAKIIKRLTPPGNAKETISE